MAEQLEIFRKDYRFPDYHTKTVELCFKIFDGHTQVRRKFERVSVIQCRIVAFARVRVHRNMTCFSQVSSSLKVKRTTGADSNSPMLLNAEDLELKSISIDGRQLTSRSNRDCKHEREGNASKDRPGHIRVPPFGAYKTHGTRILHGTIILDWY